MTYLNRFLLTVSAIVLAACATAQPTLRPAPMQRTDREIALEDSLRAALIRVALLEDRLRAAGAPLPSLTATPSVRSLAQDSTTRTGTTTPRQTATPQAPASAPQRGSRGGCYVITGSGKKRYVDRSRC